MHSIQNYNVLPVSVNTPYVYKVFDWPLRSNEDTDSGELAEKEVPEDLPGQCASLFRFVREQGVVRGNDAESCHGRMNRIDWMYSNAKVSNEIISLFAQGRA